MIHVPQFPEMTKDRGYDQITDLHGHAIFSSLSPGAKILDVGSGDGVFVRQMKERGYRVDGIDINGSGHDHFMVDLNDMNTLRKLAISRCGYYDVIVSSFTSQYLQRPLESLILLDSMLCDGGIMSYHLGYQEQYIGKRSIQEALASHHMTYREKPFTKVYLYDTDGNRYHSLLDMMGVIAQYKKIDYRPYSIPQYKHVDTGLLLSKTGDLFPRHGDKYTIHQLIDRA